LHWLELSAKWVLRDIKCLKLGVRFNLGEMTLGSPGPSYLIYLRPMRPGDAAYEIRRAALKTP
jgi:hypothetical protein